MAERRQWCRVRIVGNDDAVLADATLIGSGIADLGLVDVVARLVLVARRLGAVVRVEEPSDELRQLLALAALPVEVQGELEGGEEPRGLEKDEEEAHLGDPA